MAKIANFSEFTVFKDSGKDILTARICPSSGPLQLPVSVDCFLHAAELE